MGRCTRRLLAITHLHTDTHIASLFSPKTAEALCSMHLCASFQSSACTSIFGEQMVFDVRQACRVTLRLTTSVLAQFDSLPEKLTFIQNSLLLLYIAEKLKIWKTVALFFWHFWRQSLFFLQPGRKHPTSTSRSSIHRCRSRLSPPPGSWFFFFTFGLSGFYIYSTPN